MRKKRIDQRKRRHQRLRRKVFGTSQRPRLCVHRSSRNLSAQLIDDTVGKSLLSLSTFDKGVRDIINYGGNTKVAETLGRLMAERAKTKGIKDVVFDRGGYLYHGRVKAFAEAARKEGLIF